MDFLISGCSTVWRSPRRGGSARQDLIFTNRPTVFTSASTVLLGESGLNRGEWVLLIETVQEKESVHPGHILQMFSVAAGRMLKIAWRSQINTESASFVINDETTQIEAELTAADNSQNTQTPS